jgi:hypothetical protein
MADSFYREGGVIALLACDVLVIRVLRGRVDRLSGAPYI